MDGLGREKSASAIKSEYMSVDKEVKSVGDGKFCRARSLRGGGLLAKVHRL